MFRGSLPVLLKQRYESGSATCDEFDVSGVTGLNGTRVLSEEVGSSAVFHVAVAGPVRLLSLSAKVVQAVQTRTCDKSRVIIVKQQANYRDIGMVEGHGKEQTLS